MRGHPALPAQRAKTSAAMKGRKLSAEHRTRLSATRKIMGKTGGRKRIYPDAKTCVRAADLRRDFGITLEDYNEMFDRQNGCCAICGKHQSVQRYRLSVDHNHETGMVRGLLCVKCNAGLGNFNENPGLFDAAKSYLARKV